MVFLFLASDYLVSGNILFLSFSWVQPLLKLYMSVLVIQWVRGAIYVSKII